MKLKPLIYLVVFPVLALSGCGESAKTPEAAPAPKASPPPAAQAPQDRGAVLYKKCRVCHTLGQGERHKIGPNLYGFLDVKAGQKADFNYSKAMQAADITWTDENLSAYIEKPATFLPGTQMTFAGIRKAEDRAALIDYLKRETGAQ